MFEVETYTAAVSIRRVATVISLMCHGASAAHPADGLLRANVHFVHRSPVRPHRGAGDDYIPDETGASAAEPADVYEPTYTSSIGHRLDDVGRLSGGL